MSKVRGRVVELADPRARSAAENSRTIVATYRDADLAIVFRLLFVAHYDRIRATCLELAEPGLAVFAIDRWTGWKGTMYLASRPGEVRAGVVGRHSSADLFLGHDPTISLRHLLFVVEPCSLPQALRGEVRFRMLDLNTGSPPSDEEGRAVESLTAEGPVFLTCQDHAIMAFVTGDPTDWPESAGEAWDSIPERVFVEERLAPTAAGSAPSPLPGGPASLRAEGHADRVTIVRHHDGLVHIGARAGGKDRDVHGKLMILSGEKADRFAVSREGLRRGLLVGRYKRCEASGENGIDDEGVSRVHLVVVEIAGRPFAIDVNSSNGTFRWNDESESFEQIRTTHLDDGDLLALGGRGTAVGWSAVAAVADDVRHVVPDTEGVPRVAVKRPPAAVRSRPPAATRSRPSATARSRPPAGRRPRRPAAAPARAAAVAPSANRSVSNGAAPAPVRLTPTEFLRQQPRYLASGPLERLAWESHYIPLALWLLERGGSVPIGDAATLGQFPAEHLAIVVGALGGDGLGIFTSNWTARIGLLPEIYDILRLLTSPA